jgi:hypothetical protein
MHVELEQAHHSQQQPYCHRLDTSSLEVLGYWVKAEAHGSRIVPSMRHVHVGRQK